MRLLGTTLIILFGLLGMTGASLAQAPLPFPEIWKKVRRNAPTPEAARHELEAAKTAAARAGRHWFPVLYADARAFSTNDPGAAFFGKLSQRQITQSDFAPDLLNEPNAEIYEKLTLGLNLPLFEGGVRVAQNKAARRMADARTLDVETADRKMYAESARLYGLILTYEQALRDLDGLEESVDTVVSRYRIGAESNPVGYSGLLGLKGIKNRVAGTIAENNAKLQATKRALADLAETLPADWKPQRQNTVEFVKAYLNATGPAGAPSTKVQSFEAMADAAQAAVNAERAKFLPTVGLFAEGNLYGGERSSATSYAAGAYLRWDLFTAPNIGAVKQAQASSAAARAHAEEARLFEGIETAGAVQAADALERNIALLDNSSTLLDEQTRMARKLFLNGAMNALQLTEVFSRRADLIVSRSEASSKYLEVKATLANNTNFKPIGDSNE